MAVLVAAMIMAVVMTVVVMVVVIEVIETVDTEGEMVVVGVESMVVMTMMGEETTEEGVEEEGVEEGAIIEEAHQGQGSTVEVGKWLWETTHFR